MMHCNARAVERKGNVENSQVTSIVGTNMIMILETTSGGRSTGTVPLTWDGMMRYKYIQGQSMGTPRASKELMFPLVRYKVIKLETQRTSQV
jgi:hypothetical protein